MPASQKPYFPVSVCTFVPTMPMIPLARLLFEAMQCNVMLTMSHHTLSLGVCVWLFSSCVYLNGNVDCIELNWIELNRLCICHEMFLRFSAVSLYYMSCEFYSLLRNDIIVLAKRVKECGCDLYGVDDDDDDGKVEKSLQNLTHSCSHSHTHGSAQMREEVQKSFSCAFRQFHRYTCYLISENEWTLNEYGTQSENVLITMTHNIIVNRLCHSHNLIWINEACILALPSPCQSHLQAHHFTANYISTYTKQFNDTGRYKGYTISTFSSIFAFAHRQHNLNDVVCANSHFQWTFTLVHSPGCFRRPPFLS